MLSHAHAHTQNTLRNKRMNVRTQTLSLHSHKSTGSLPVEHWFVNRRNRGPPRLDWGTHGFGAVAGGSSSGGGGGGSAGGSFYSRVPTGREGPVGGAHGLGGDAGGRVLRKPEERFPSQSALLTIQVQILYTCTCVCVRARARVTLRGIA